MNLFKNVSLFRLLLQLIAIHSFLVGLGLIVLPFGVLSWFGFTVDPYRFFSAQGGVFHVVMSIGYFLAARNPRGEKNLIIFIILAKWIAFFFLAFYFLFSEMVPVIAFSAVSDGLMGLIVMMFFLELYTQEEMDG
ncbi:MAG: hypothetical protein K9M55_00130 [Candidatus Marinimicrobia bacterium]|nr:hypothetical protein [Candidatus Neomarinimicrobiota bacterium]MCF7921083.1 hypothetical protein [Candidatus Neomarinimicrobiota bacterium]